LGEGKLSLALTIFDKIYLFAIQKIGDFQLLKLIGKGSFAKVCLAIK
jgi:hypothetical protein